MYDRRMAYWTADIDEDATTSFVWQPFLWEDDGLLVGRIGVWFDSRQRAEDFIRRTVLGARLEAD